MKRVLITGATGLIGKNLVNALVRRGDEVIALTTNIEKAKSILEGVKYFRSLQDYLSLKDEKIDAIVNLAGVNLGEKRWNTGFKKQVYDSRIKTTSQIVELIRKMENKPEVLVSASGVDYYGDRGNDDVYEDSKPADNFAAKMCVGWESEAMKAEIMGVRVVTVRTGFVMDRDSEAVQKLVKPFRFFTGGYPGSGKQYMSWIHMEDVTGIYLYAIDNNTVKGAINAASPNPVPMKEFCREIGIVLKRKVLLPVPSFIVLLIAGGVGSLVLNGRRALPKKINGLGFKFKFEKSLDAWVDILK